MVRHPISQTSGVKIGPSVNMERGFVSKSGAGDAEFGVFATEISRNVWLDSMITRDLGNVLWVGIDVLRDLCVWMFIVCL
jgi:hypothetical protein